MRFRKVLLSCLLASITICACQPEGIIDPGKNNGNGNTENIPKTQFSTIEYNGFTFKIRTYLENTPDAKAAISHAKKDVDKIKSLLPASAVEVMRKNPIWFELDIQPDGAAWYHTDLNFLKSNGYMTEKHKCVEISNYVHYVEWADINQPFMILHELCHLYHDHVYTFQDKDIIAAYKHAYTNGMYRNTPYFDGRNTYNIEKAYAMNDAMEYFSEICEAYWGKNDYYPFDYYDLMEYDPQGFELMEKVWGKRDL